MEETLNDKREHGTLPLNYTTLCQTSIVFVGQMASYVEQIKNEPEAKNNQEMWQPQHGVGLRCSQMKLQIMWNTEVKEQGYIIALLRLGLQSHTCPKDSLKVQGSWQMQISFPFLLEYLLEPMSIPVKVLMVTNLANLVQMVNQLNVPLPLFPLPKSPEREPRCEEE